MLGILRQPNLHFTLSTATSRFCFASWQGMPWKPISKRLLARVGKQYYRLPTRSLIFREGVGNELPTLPMRIAINAALAH